MDLIVDVHVLANVGMPLLAIAAAATGDVKGNRHNIALADEFDIAAQFDNFACHLVTHHHPFGHREAAMIYVLVASADIGRHDLQDCAVLYLPAFRVGQLGEIGTFHGDTHRSLKPYNAIVGHVPSPFAWFLFWPVCAIRPGLPLLAAKPSTTGRVSGAGSIGNAPARMTWNLSSNQIAVEDNIRLPVTSESGLPPVSLSIERLT
jgi:hypothetical protein